MYIKTSIILFLLLVVITSYCQNHQPRLFIEDSVQLRGSQLFINNKKVRLQQARIMFSKYEESAIEFNRFAKQRRNILIFDGVVMASSFVILARSPGAVIAIAAADALIGLGSYLLHRKATRHLLRSVQLYNQKSIQEFLY